MVVENPVPDGYTARISTSGSLPDGDYCFDIENTHTPEPPITSLTVQKKWVGDSSADRPESITVQLYQDGTAYGDPVELSDANNWRYTWLSLNGSFIWTVDEVAVPEGYEKTVTNTGTSWTVTNTLKEEPEAPTPPPSEEPKPRDVPKTGDSSQTGFWLAMMSLSMLGIAAVSWMGLVTRRGKRES